ncbi:hypothetical protein V6N11_045291 [Hibiscus sabdariffa]|uniref:Helicase C-terminal domain-containing protein n=1 Tax=Hibiscus sabdariffa TaxID=183260 RepID=A0ABR2Q0H1_9ROSI
MSNILPSLGKALKGRSQKVQQAVLEKFRAGGYNVIVATSIGEEGLDIMEVDLVTCFDANVSPLRMIQPIGRTEGSMMGELISFCCFMMHVKMWVVLLHCSSCLTLSEVVSCRPCKKKPENDARTFNDEEAEINPTAGSTRVESGRVDMMAIYRRAFAKPITNGEATNSSCFRSQDISSLGTSTRVHKSACKEEYRGEDLLGIHAVEVQATMLLKNKSEPSLEKQEINGQPNPNLQNKE